MLASDVIDRTYAEWLAPAGVDRPSYDLLLADMDAFSPVAGGTFEVVGRLTGGIPRDSVLEIDSEVILTRDTAPPVITVQDRGYLDTVPAAHVAGTKVYVSPKYTRLTLLHALSSIIGQLYPWGLYQRATVDTTVNTREVRALPDGGKTILSILVRTGGSLERYDELRYKGRDWKEYDQFTPTRYIILRGWTNLACVVCYKKDFALPTTEADDLTVLGLPETLQPYLPLAVAGYVLQSKEIPRVQVEEIRRMLALNGIQVGQAMNIGEQMLAKFKQTYVSAERRRLREMDPVRLEWASA